MQTQAQQDLTGSALNAQRFRMLEDIARELQGEVIFPINFDIALRIRKLSEDPTLSLDRLAAAINLDPLIAVRLLRMANSAAYNPGGQEVRDLTAAIGRLGLKTVRSTAMAIAMRQLLRSREMVDFMDLADRLWEHTLHCAAAASVVARRLTRLNPDDALLAGLLHDLGAFYMLYRAAQYAELRARPDSLRHLVIQWHEGIGVSLLGALGVDEQIIEAVRDHDQPRPLPAAPKTLAEVVHVANLLAGGTFEPTGGAGGTGDDPYASLADTAYPALREEIDVLTERMRAAID
jgi:putative nucleotidyltransferase with HDIG domain